MRVHLIKRQTVEDFAIQYPGSRASLNDWLGKLKFADWDEPSDIKRTYNAVDVLGRNSNRVIFDIAGNNYRMICKYAFGANQVHLFVCWIGTHAEYDKICKAGSQYSINIY